ncbi:putative endo-beta-1,4-glucanase D [Paramyrothecium foliicola]|nr:putative endo-beta-1,4-glucanase D [Paramyrothecium foliicola]
MKLSFYFLGLASIANAHTLFTTLRINDKNQGDGTCVRQPSDPSSATSPVYPIDGDEMACGYDGGKAVPFICPAPSGSKLTFEFRAWPEFEKPLVIDDGHKGPCAVYIKKVDDMFSDSAAGPGWMKIWEDGYNVETNRWCVDTLIENNGLLSVNLPTSLPAGYYIVRPEVIALHFAYKGDPQFYTSCAQIFIEGGPGGSLDIPSEYETSIPGYVSGDESGLSYNIYDNDPSEYTIPGPKVYRPSADGQAKERMSQEEGVIPEECLVKNANWCALPIASYSGESDCWAGSKACWKQSSACYDSMPPTGAANCEIWGDYCETINEACNAGDFEGPPTFRGEEIFASSYENIPEPWGQSVWEANASSKEGVKGFPAAPADVAALEIHDEGPKEANDDEEAQTKSQNSSGGKCYSRRGRYRRHKM